MMLQKSFEYADLLLKETFIVIIINVENSFSCYTFLWKQRYHSNIVVR